MRMYRVSMDETWLPPVRPAEILAMAYKNLRVGVLGHPRELIVGRKGHVVKENSRVYYVAVDTTLPGMDNREMEEEPVTLMYMDYRVSISSASGLRADLSIPGLRRLFETLVTAKIIPR